MLLEGDELIAYATRENDVADDGEGAAHSPFTTAFLRHLQEPGLEVRFLFGNVRDNVRTATGSAQTPTTYGDLGGAYFYFRPPQPKAETLAPLPPLSEAAEAWRLVENSNSEAVLEAFTKRFGETAFGDFARARLTEITHAAENTPVKPKEEETLSATGTHWQGRRTGNPGDTLAVWFSGGGSMRWETSMERGEGQWKQKGNRISWNINNYSDYEGIIVSPTVMEGKGSNGSGLTWNWRLEKTKDRH